MKRITLSFVALALTILTANSRSPGISPKDSVMKPSPTSKPMAPIGQRTATMPTAMSTTGRT